MGGDRHDHFVCEKCGWQGAMVSVYLAILASPQEAVWKLVIGLQCPDVYGAGTCMIREMIVWRSGSAQFFCCKWFKRSLWYWDTCTDNWNGGLCVSDSSEQEDAAGTTTELAPDEGISELELCRQFLCGKASGVSKGSRKPSGWVSLDKGWALWYSGWRWLDGMRHWMNRAWRYTGVWRPDEEMAWMWI